MRLADLDTPVLITADEKAYAAAAKDDRVFASVSQSRQMREYAFDGGPYLGFAASHDLHGDGSIIVVPAPGHTPGSVIAFVTLPWQQRFAFIGDLTWQLDGIQRNVERPWLMRKLADSDPRQIRLDLARVTALADRFQVVPAPWPRA